MATTLTPMSDVNQATLTPITSPEDDAVRSQMAREVELGQYSDFGRANLRGQYGLGASLANMYGQLVEPFSEQAAQPAFNYALSNKGAAQYYGRPSDITDYNQVRSLGDAGNYALNMVGENVAQLPLALGGAGLARLGLRGMLSPMAANFVGASAGSFPALMGENVEALRSDKSIMDSTTPLERLAHSAGAAAIQAPLDSVGDALLMGRATGLGKTVANVFKDGFGKTALDATKHIAKAVPEAALTEGVPETGQELVKQGMLSKLNPERDTSGDANALANSFFGGWAAGAPISGVGRGADVAWAQGRGATDAIRGLLEKKVLPRDLHDASDRDIVDWDNKDEAQRNSWAKDLADRILSSDASESLKDSARSFYDNLKNGGKRAWSGLSDALNMDEHLTHAREGIDRFVGAAKDANNAAFGKANAESSEADNAAYEVMRTHLDPNIYNAKFGGGTDRAEALYGKIKSALLEADGNVESLGTHFWEDIAPAFKGAKNIGPVINDIRDELVRHGELQYDPQFKDIFQRVVDDKISAQQARVEVLQRYSPHGRQFMGERGERVARGVANNLQRGLENYDRMSKADKLEFDSQVKQLFGKNAGVALEAFKPTVHGQQEADTSIGSGVSERETSPTRFIGQATKESRKTATGGAQENTIASHGGFFQLEHKDEATRKKIKKDFDSTQADLRKDGFYVKPMTPLEYHAATGISKETIAHHLGYGKDVSKLETSAARILSVEPRSQDAMRFDKDDTSLDKDDITALAERTKKSLSTVPESFPVTDSEQRGKIDAALGLSGGEQRKAMKALGLEHGVKLVTRSGTAYLHNNLKHGGNGVFNVVMKERDASQEKAWQNKLDDLTNPIDSKTNKPKTNWKKATPAEIKAAELDSRTHHISAQHLISLMRERGKGTLNDRSAYRSFLNGIAALQANEGVEKITANDIWGRTDEHPFAIAPGVKNYFQLEKGLPLHKAHRQSLAKEGSINQPTDLEDALDSADSLEEQLKIVEDQIEALQLEAGRQPMDDQQRAIETAQSYNERISELEDQRDDILNELEAQRDVVDRLSSEQKQFETLGSTGDTNPGEKRLSSDDTVTPMEKESTKPRIFDEVTGEQLHPYGKNDRDSSDRQNTVFNGVPLRLSMGVSAKHIVGAARQVVATAKKIKEILKGRDTVTSQMDIALDLVARAAAAQKDGNRVAQEALTALAANRILQAALDEMEAIQIEGQHAAESDKPALRARYAQMRDLAAEPDVVANAAKGAEFQKNLDAAKDKVNAAQEKLDAAKEAFNEKYTEKNRKAVESATKALAKAQEEYGKLDVVRKYAPYFSGNKFVKRHDFDNAADRASYHQQFAATLEGKTTDEIKAEGVARAARIERYKTYEQSPGVQHLLAMMEAEQEASREVLRGRKGEAEYQATQVGTAHAPTEAAMVAQARIAKLQEQLAKNLGEQERSKKNKKSTAALKDSEQKIRDEISSLTRKANETKPLSVKSASDSKATNTDQAVKEREKQAEEEAKQAASQAERNALTADSDAEKNERSLTKLAEKEAAARAADVAKKTAAVEEDEREQTELEQARTEREAQAQQARAEREARAEQTEQKIEAELTNMEKLGKDVAALTKAVRSAWSALKDSYIKGELQKPELVKALREAVAALRSAVGNAAAVVREQVQKFIAAYQKAQPVSKDVSAVREYGKRTDDEALEAAADDWFEKTGAKVRYRPGSMKATRIKAAANELVDLLDTPFDVLDRSDEKLGPFDGFVTHAVVVEEHNALYQFNVPMELAEKLDDNPSLKQLFDSSAVTMYYDMSDGDLGVYGPQLDSTVLKKAGDSVTLTGEEDAPTRLEGVSTDTMTNLLGDMHARLQMLSGEEHISYRWERKTGAAKEHGTTNKVHATRFNAESVEIHNELGKEGFAATHDSPIRHEGKFNWREHAGKGEGNASFGIGTYLSTSDGVHESYKKKFTAETMGGGFISDVSRESEVRDTLQEELADIDKTTSGQELKGIVLDILRDQMREYSEGSFEKQMYADAYFRAKDMVASDFTMGDGKPSPTYQVTVNAENDEILDWDKKLNEQPEAVQKAVEAALAKYMGDTPIGKAGGYKIDSGLGFWSGSEIYRMLDTKMVKNIRSYVKGESASDALQEFGIVGHKYAASNGKNDTHPNYVIYDDSRIETNYVQFNKEGSFANGQGVTQQQFDEAKDYIAKVLGPKVKVELAKTLGGNSAAWNRVNGEAIIRIAAKASNPLSKAHHEAMHEFFQRLMDASSPVADDLRKLANNKLIVRQIEQFFHNDANYSKIQKALATDEHERVAYMFQLWAAGKLKLGPQNESLFQKVKTFLKKVFGMISDSQRAEAIMAHFHAGDLADMNDVARVLTQDKSAVAELVQRANDFAKPLVGKLQSLAYTAQNTLTESAYKSFEKIGRLFSTETGRTNEDISFFDGKMQKTNQYMDHFAKIVRATASGDMEKALDGLQQGVTSKDQNIAHAQASIRKLLDHMYDYMKTAGMNVRKTQNYFPRSWDFSKIRENRAEFAKMLMDEHQAVTGKPLPQHVADGIVDNIILNKGAEPLTEDELKVGYTPFMQASNRRVLDFVKDPKFADYQTKDIESIMTNYIAQAVHKAEYTRRFGQHGEKLRSMVNDGIGEAVGPEWTAARKAAEAKRDAEQKRLEALHPKDKGKVRQEMAAQGYVGGEVYTKHILAELSDPAARAKFNAFEPELNRYNRAIMGMEGTLGYDINPSLRKLNSTLIVYENMRLLGLSLFAQVIDPLGTLVRGGDLSDAYNTFKRGMSSTIAAWRGTPLEDSATELAMRLGIIDAASYLNSQADSYASVYLGKKAKYFNDKLFRWNGVEGFSQGTRVGAMEAAIKFIKAHKSLPTDHSERWLAELNLKPADIKLDKKGDLDYSDPKIQQAIFRWVEGAILRPNAAMRPSWASDPHFALVWHMKQFTYAAQKVLLERVFNEAKHGNYDPAITMVLTYVPAMIVADTLRGLMANGGQEPPWKRKWTPGDYIAEGVQRAGLLGVPQLGLDVAKWGPAELAGPAAEQVAKAGKVFQKNIAKDYKLDRIAEETGREADRIKAESFVGVEHAAKKTLRDALPINSLSKRYIYDEVMGK